MCYIEPRQCTIGGSAIGGGAIGRCAVARRAASIALVDSVQRLNGGPPLPLACLHRVFSLLGPQGGCLLLQRCNLAQSYAFSARASLCYEPASDSSQIGTFVWACILADAADYLHVAPQCSPILTIKVCMRQPAADVECHPAGDGGTNTLQQHG